ncbi:hypothetical protein [uncultured Anaerococcus sp.]|uniref:hypothetical protein n=1 Tax=uncultured Anaerococcus sp. TaxID=293428 RepID=UPI0025CF8421|nr:hypothetical protein [uncultured Anaerococcus sp.]
MTYKNTFEMIGGDIVIDGDLKLVKGKDELRQNIENRLSVNKEEWFLNLGLGLDYAAISGKGITDRQIELAIRECCLQDSRVKEARDVKVSRDSKKRTADIDIVIIDKNDEDLYLKEVVDIG